MNRRVIAIAFGKGGTGKTSTALALINYAAHNGRRVLAIDCGQQANLSYSLQADLNAPGLYSVLTGQKSAAEVIQRTAQADVIPAGVDLTAAEAAINGRPGRDFILRAAVEGLRAQYDLIVIDTQPDLNCILINALSAADGVILPMAADTYSMLGLYQMANTINQVKQYCNPGLDVMGIVLTRFKPRQTMAASLRESIAAQAKEMNTRLCDTYIREGVAISKAQGLQQNLFEYAPNSNPAHDYFKLFLELEIFRHADRMILG